MLIIGSKLRGKVSCLGARLMQLQCCPPGDRFVLKLVLQNGPSSSLCRVAQVTNSAGFLLDSMFDFADRMNALSLSDDEVALFSAIVIIASGQ